MSNAQKKAAGIGVFALAMTIIGNVVGVGFSTGREIMTYFGNFGKSGIAGIVVSFALLAVFAPITYSTAKNMNCYSFDWVVTPLGWKPLRIFNTVFTLVGLSSSVSAMIAASGAILKALFQVPYLVGCLLMAAACLITVIFSLNKFSDVMSAMVPVMVVLAISICLICVIRPVTPDGGWDVVDSSSNMAKTWWLSALVYFGYNVGPIIQLVTPMTPSIKDSKTSIISSVLFYIALVAVAICAMLAIVFNYPICSSEALPTVTMGFYKAPIFGILYGVVAMIAIYSTCTAFLFIFKSVFAKSEKLRTSNKKMVLLLLVLVLACLGASFIGYSNFVDKVWTVLGYFGLIGVAGTVFNFFYYRKHPVTAAPTKEEE